jgi:hypothetical protein
MDHALRLWSTTRSSNLKPLGAKLLELIEFYFGQFTFPVYKCTTLYQEQQRQQNAPHTSLLGV